jgi:hypothetical protein
MRDNFVWLAILIAVPLLVLQLIFGVRTAIDEQGIPLLTILIMNEFGALLCAIAAGMSVRTMKNSGLQAPLVLGTLAVSVLAIIFIWRLLLLYPH